MKIQEFQPLKADYNRLKSRSSTIDLRSLRKTDLFKENLSQNGLLTFNEVNLKMAQNCCDSDRVT